MSHSLGHIPSFLASQSHVCFQNGGAGSSECKSNSAAAKKELVWSESAVWALLEAYEDKWRQLDWGNLKGKHWEDVSTTLSAYGQWSYKTPMQCKNKIEDMKKKYKEKLLRGGGSSKWPYFDRMELMFRNASSAKANSSGGDAAATGVALGCTGPLEVQALDQKCGFDEEVDGDEDDPEDEDEYESENDDHQAHGNARDGQNRAKRKAEDSGQGCGGGFKHQRRDAQAGEAVSAIRALGELIVRVESSKMEGQRQLMLLRAQAENKRIDAEMRMAEMVMNSQLFLAKSIAEYMKDDDND